MSNNEVIKHWISFCNNTKKDKKLEYKATANVHCSKKYLYSYATPIAKFEDGKFYLTSVKYSQTTSRQQNIVKQLVNPGDLIIVDAEINED